MIGKAQLLPIRLGVTIRYGAQYLSRLLLNERQRLGQRDLVAGMQLDVIAASGIGIKADCVANNERDGFGFSFTHPMSRRRPAVTSVEQFMGNFVNQDR